MDAETAAYEASVEKLKSQIDVVTEAILAVCKEQNVDSLRTPSGTVTRRISTRYWTSDWSGMYDFIKDHGAPQLLEQRIHRTNMKQFLEENPGVEPVGLNIDRRYAITVRKPTEK
jgi:hypothetical protein